MNEYTILLVEELWINEYTVLLVEELWSYGYTTTCRRDLEL